MHMSTYVRVVRGLWPERIWGCACATNITFVVTVVVTPGAIMACIGYAVDGTQQGVRCRLMRMWMVPMGAVWMMTMEDETS